MKKIIFSLLVLMPGLCFANIKTEGVTYKFANQEYEGMVAYDEAKQGPRPTILVVHEWWGINPYIESRVRQLAEMGYTAVAIDIYGKGKRTSDPKQAGEWATALKSDRALMRDRANAGLKMAKGLKVVDPKNIAMIGFCFGGTVSLEAARAGMDLKGVVSFHGGLDTPHPEDAGKIKGKVLVLHGADDPYVPEAQVAAFEDEMRKAKVNWQLNEYSGAVHAFTNANAGNDPSKGAAYNEQAATRSWRDMQAFLNEIFGQ